MIVIDSFKKAVFDEWKQERFQRVELFFRPKWKTKKPF